MPNEVTIRIDRETDGRFIADIETVPGVTVYGGTKDEAVQKAIALYFRVLAKMLRTGRSLSCRVYGPGKPRRNGDRSDRIWRFRVAPSRCRGIA